MTHSTSITYLTSDHAKRDLAQKTKLDFLNTSIATKVRTFHKSFPQYKKTPLHTLDNLSHHLGVSKIWVKDESYRFNLNAFKVLGATYAIGNYLSQRINKPISELSFEKLRSEAMKKVLGNLTFVTATDGNHGRGVAWAASQLGHNSVVFMPRGSSAIRLEHIRKEGAEAFITDSNYDDTVRLATQYAKDHNAILLQDSAWEGYTDIPTWIMQGYVTIMCEILEQIDDSCTPPPTHIFLQAGVGSFAGSMLGHLVSRFGKDAPITAIIEPQEAACIYKSALSNDGKPHPVTGLMPTIMAGLACGEPNIVSWEILRDYADIYLSCPDFVAARGMRILGNPIGDDPRVVSGESGAVGLGLLSVLLEQDHYSELVKQLKIDSGSRILLISTEGDTDPKHYRNIVWDGRYTSNNDKIL